MVATQPQKRIAAGVLLSGGLALAALGLGAGTAQAFDPQPDPPGTERGFNPQPEPPVRAITGVHPQQERLAKAQISAQIGG
ncbi:MAG: hypothetical protein QOD39_2293 [Mycobacterium sp.]|jgi:hypothetical protein|nr:hypothetical protein [Mycobacterium sp.]